jgi:amino acid adenylation domain-containing protein
VTERALISQRLASLPREQRELLIKRLEAKTKTIQPRQPGERIPLTYGQERLWLVDQIAEQNPAYNESNFIRFPYAIDVSLFRQAINEVIRRHESLRTIIDVSDGELSQKVLPSLVLNLPLVDLRRFPIEMRESEALRLAAEEGRAAVSLTEGPLLRGSLYRLADNDYLFALMLHHIICDGWSIGVLAVELSTLYWSFLGDKPSPLLPLKIQYPDFAIWQRRSLNDQVLAAQLDYWRNELAGVLTLDLPGDRPRPRQFTYRGGRCPVEIPKTVYASLRKFCEREDVTPQILLLAVFNILLHRYSGQDDIAVITPVAGRNRKELEPLIGFFVNSLVVRTDLSGNPSFAELLARVRKKSVNAFANQDVPFERLIEELKPVRDKSRNPIAQVAFQIFQPPSVPDLDPKYVFPFTPVETGISKFDLTLQLILSKESLQGHIEYYADLYPAAQIERLRDHFCRLLESAIKDRGQRISELATLSSDEERQQLVDWNGTEAEYPRDSNIPAVFKTQTAARPDQIAVRYEDRSLTYARLDQHTSSLAEQLIALGVRKGETVGLLMDRSLEFPVALLGITKAGGISVPLDPAYPIERQSHLIENSGANILVTSRTLLERASSVAKQVLVAEDVVEQAISKEHVSVAIEPDDVACLMYTSGATGGPKGVAITHRNILRLARGISAVSITDKDVVAQIGAISRDASLFEIWGALLNGATVAVYPAGKPSLNDLGAFIRNSEISTLLIAPSLFRQMMESKAADLRSVRRLIMGGGVMPLALASTAFKNLPRTKLFNAYGPTECTTLAVIYPLTSIAAVGDSVPIGRPVENTTIYILNEHTNLLPVGAVGEICIGGDGVAKGYWNQPQLTARNFVADPFSGGRMYRTGDLGKYRADGNILFLGRRDRQVKLSGYKIDLGELETAVATHSAVAAVAVVLTGVDDETRLTAFVELVPGSTLTYAQLREFLSAKLPGYMIPSHLEILEELPRSVNGDVDYVALSQRPRSADVAREEDVAPRTRAEHLLVELWQEILAAERVRVTDNFFDLGGHSLVATRLLSRVRETFQTEVTMGQFFDNPTVAGLAAIVSSNGKPSSRAGTSAPS